MHVCARSFRLEANKSDLGETSTRITVDLPDPEKAIYRRRDVKQL